MKVLVIDDNLNWLQAISKNGHGIHYCLPSDSVDDIIENLNASVSGNLDKVYINVSLICKNYDKRQSYGGFYFYKRLVNHIKSDNWYLISFEDSKKLIMKLSNFENYSKLSIIDYINLIKSI